MVPRLPFRKSVRAVLAVFTLLCVLFGTGSRALDAQTLTSPVGTASSTQTVTVTLTGIGAAGSVVVVTEGATTLDFAQVTGGTCATAVSVGGTTCTVQYTFTPTYPGTRYGSAIVYDGLGNVLGNAFLTGVGTGPQLSYGLVPSNTELSQISGPSGIAVDSARRLYIANTTSNTVVRYPGPGGGSIATIGSGFSMPAAVAVDGAGNVYVADAGNQAVKELVANNTTNPTTYSAPVTLATGYTFTNPLGVAVDANGNVYVADQGAGKVVEIAAANGMVSATSTATALSQTFSKPVSVAFDGKGNLYVADQGTNSIVELPAGGGTSVTLASGLTAPQGLAVDTLGNVFFGGMNSTVVNELVASATGVAANSTPVVAVSGLGSALGVAVYSSGDLFVADFSNNAVSVFVDTPPSLAFSSTVVGSTSGDSPEIINLQNTGNAPLTIGPLTSGNNPAITASFTLGTGTGACPVVAPTGTAATLASGASCTYSVSFTPVTAGNPTNGTLTLTDDNLNAANPPATQAFGLSGTSTPQTPSISVDPASASVNGTNVTLHATVGFGGVPPTGAFSFTVSPSTTSISATCATQSATALSCTASYNPSALQAGSYTIQGTIAADGNYNTNSGSNTLTVNAATPTVTLTTSGSPSTVDSPVTLTAAIAPNTGTVPTGSVSFSTTVNGTTSTISGCSNVQIVNGSAKCVTAALQAGANSIVATLSKDNNFNSASSSPVTQTVTASSTTLTITSSQPASSTVNQAVTFTATLSAAQAFTVTPMGTVKFTSNGTTIPNCGAVQLSTSNQTATCIAYALVAPSDAISAVFSSTDGNFSGSTAATFAQVVGKAIPVNTVSSNLQPSSAVNQTVTFIATITPPNTPSSTGVTPTGYVTFTNGTGGSQICQQAVVNPGSGGTGTASCSVAFSSASTGMNIVAAYSGDQNFTVGNQPSVSQVVSQTSTTIPASSIVTNPGTPTVNQSVSLSATLTPTYTGSTTPGGSVTFYDTLGSTTTTACTSNVSSGTVVPCSYTFSATGMHTLKAVYSGDPNFSTTTSTNMVSVVASGTVILNLTTSASPIVVNQTATYSAAFSPTQTGPTYPTGTVQYFDGSTAIASCNVTVSPTGTIPNCTETLTTAATHIISAVFTSTNSNFSTITSGNLGEVVNQNTTRTTLTSPSAASSVDQVIPFSATVTPATLTPAATGTTAPGGTVLFSYTLNGINTTICSASVTTANGVSSATCSAALTSAVTYPITAVYSGDGNFVTSSSAAYSQVVNKTGTTLGVAGASISSPATPAVNQSASYTVQLSLAGSLSDAGLTVPSGSVTLKDTGNGLTCTAPLSTSGQASCTLAEPTAGPHTILATYPGDNNFVGSSASFPVTIITSTTSIASASISSNPSSPMVNQTGVVLNATLAPSYTGTAQPSGTLTFTDMLSTGTTPLGTCNTTVTNGVVAPCSYVFTTAGTHTITAKYSGDLNFSTITQTGSVVVGGVGSLGITLASTTGPVIVNQQATYSAVFSPVQNGPTYPAGTVQFFDAGNAIPGCNVTVSSTGTIPSCTETMTTAATHVITAAFTSSNSSAFSSTTSGNLPQVVNQNATNVALTAPSAPSSVNQIVTFAAILSPATLNPAAVGSTVPAGTVTFNGTNSSNVTVALCTANVTTVSGTTSASCTAPFTASGSYGVTAVYSGDGNFKTNTSTSFSEVVNKTNTSVSLVTGMMLTNPASPAANQTATYTVQVTPAVSSTGLTLPTGNVIFADSTNPGAGCTAVLVASTGQASCSFSTTGNGTHNVVATYTGDGNFNGAAQTFQEAIALSSPTLSITAPTTNPTINLAGFAFNSSIAVPAGSSGQPSGSVTYSNSVGGVLCKAPISGGVVAPCAYTFGSAGIQNITAIYSGDSSFGSTTANLPITVAKATPVLNLVSAAPTSVAGQQVTFTATVTPSPAAINLATGTPSGTVTFAFTTGSVSNNCTPSYSFAGGTETATCTVTFVLQSNGTYSVTATYSGDGNYNTTQNSIVQNVQNFSPSLTPGSVLLGEGDSNTTDPYSTAPSIRYTLTAQNGFSNATVTSCPSTVSGLTCTVPSTFSIGSSVPVVISTTSSVAPGAYTLQVISQDPTSSLQQSTPLAVTVIGRVYPAGSTVPYSVPTIGQVTIPFTLPASLAGSTYTCNPNVANVGSNGTYSQTGDTLANLGLQCSVTGSGTSYTVSITAGSGTASLERGPLAKRNEVFAAGLLAPFFLLVGFSSKTRRARKAMFRVALLCLLSLAAISATGCSSGGFTRGGNQTYAVGGSYLIGINNAAGSTVTEVPLLVTGNGAGI